MTRPGTASGPSDKKPLLLSWSGGKDSAWSLHRLRSSPRWRAFEVVGLLTTVNRHFARVAIHGFREELLRLQAGATGLPLWTVDLPWPCTNADYEAALTPALQRAVEGGIHGVAFGDLFLEDIRRFREAALAPFGLEPLFPLWGEPTAALAREMIAGGLEARLTCVDPQRLTADFAGRPFDADLLADLPADVDPCGERGEFHSFAFAGPMFRRRIDVSPGHVVLRDGAVYADLLPLHPAEDPTKRAPNPR